MIWDIWASHNSRRADGELSLISLMSIPDLPFSLCADRIYEIIFLVVTQRALTCSSAVSVMQKHVATQFVPGAPSVSRISVSARTAKTRPTPPYVAATAKPTTTSVNCAGPPARCRGESMWRSTAAVMKVGNGLWNAAIMLTNHPATEVVQLSLPTDLWHGFQSSMVFHNGGLRLQQLKAWNGPEKKQRLKLAVLIFWFLK